MEEHLPSRRIIPLDPNPGPEETPVLTDVVLAWQLEDLAQQQIGSNSYFDANDLMEASSSAFALGCALGLDYASQVTLILEQTHPGESRAIISECEAPLKSLISDAKESGEEIGAELFLSGLFQVLEGEEPVEASVAYTIISIGFEYGCILAQVERRAALLVRNNFNRELAAVARVGSVKDPAQTGREPEPHTELFISLQQLAEHILSEYEQEVGFS